MNRVPVTHREADGVTLAGEFRADGLQPGPQVIGLGIAFKGKVEVFRVAREGEEKRKQVPP